MNHLRELERVTIDPATSGSAYNHPIDCDVLAVAGQTVALEAVEKQVASRLPEAIERAYLLFDRDGGTIAFRGRLLSVEPPGDLRFVIEHPETRRAATRVVVELEGTVAREGESTVDVRTVNLSADGVLLEGACPVSPGDRVAVTLLLEPGGSTVNAQATVVRVADGDRFAIQFDTAEKDTRRKLGVFTLEHNRRLLHRELEPDPTGSEPEF